MALGDKTIIEIKNADWKHYENPFHCPAALAIQAHFGSNLISANTARYEAPKFKKYYPEWDSVAIGIVDDNTVLWGIEGFVKNQDCVISLVEIKRTKTSSKTREVFVEEREYFDKRAENKRAGCDN